MCGGPRSLGLCVQKEQARAGHVLPKEAGQSVAGEAPPAKWSALALPVSPAISDPLFFRVRPCEIELTVNQPLGSILILVKATCKGKKRITLFSGFAGPSGPSGQLLSFLLNLA